jgi:ligand-binding SRPBCC domain-containing protein
MPPIAHKLYRKTLVPASVDQVFAFFSQAENLTRITPPWLHFQILSPTPISFEQGTRIDLSLKLKGIRFRWRSEITAWDPPFSFEDRQIKGPYKQWDHFHRFAPQEDHTLMEDAVVYRVPGGVLEPLVDFWFVRSKLEAIFDYRGSQLQKIFTA